MGEGDILDAFDDAQDLTKSIEKGKDGPWNDETARFEDPKVAQLQEQLEQAKQQQGYQERRMRELQQRAAEKEQKKTSPKAPAATDTAAPVWGPDAPAAAEPQPAAQQPPAGAQWGEPPTWDQHGNVEPTQADRREPNSRPNPDSPLVHARRATDRAPTEKPQLTQAAPMPEQSVLVSYAPSVFAAVLVYVAATVVHGMLDGWHVDLIARAVVAMGVTGVLWRRFQAGQLRAMAIGAAVYTASFMPSDRLGTPENVFALFLGLLTVAAGAGLIGVQRDEFGAKPR